ncbi:DUF2784 domain-containing protein [Massilia sp. YIM B02769]|uniref:DUF2784 domain-containing protein n=1 Tax=Massilia sp. YIM B02769 TaxID=3050129 RepID=UPI0025B64B36|nr:DUF2784 domain-containing protein [Massilia sp. YIM B02769]MDN4059231.1 DUF2784 domain-containing protein [Massilia sp. YIM B02769]
MGFSLAAAGVLLLHLAFVLFVVFGALLLVRWPRLAWLHLPAAAWGFFIELTGRLCPLTTLEKLLRMRAGLSGYGESFVEHYLLRLIYPGSLTREMQLGLAVGVVTINVLLYGWAFLLPRLRQRAHS